MAHRVERSIAQISFPRSVHQTTMGKGELLMITHVGYLFLLVLRGW